MKTAGFVCGIVGLCLAGLFLFIPGGVLFSTFIGGPLVALSVDRGSILGWVAGGLNIANVLFFSPTIWAATAIGGMAVPIFYIAIQVVAMLIMFFWTKALRGQKTPFDKMLKRR